MSISSFAAWLLAAEPAPGAGGENGGGRPPGLLDPGSFLWPMLIIFFIFWLLVFRPEGRRRKEREQKVKRLQKGDQVVTTGGIYGKVMRVDETEVLVQIDKEKDVRVRFAKSAVFDVVTAAAARTDGSDAVKN